MNKNSFSPTDGSLSVETKNMLNAFSEPVLITSNNGDIIFHNNSSSGFVKDFRNISEIIPGIELNGKETTDAITSVKHFNGDVKDVPVEIEVGKWDDNYIVKFKDVSKLVEFRHKIKNVERQLRECQELTSLGLWEWDVKSNMISWSDALYNIYGTNKESFSASFESFLNLVHPDDREFVKTHVEKARTGKDSFEFVHRIVTPSGDIKYLKGTGKIETDAAGNIIRMAGTGQDVTREKQLESEIRKINENLEKKVEERTAELNEAYQKLSEREKELTDFIENASLGMHWVGPDGVILWANKTELEMLGYTKEEYFGHNIAEFHANENKIKDILERLRNNETLVNYEAELICKDGSIRYVQISSNVYQEHGRFKHSRCFTRDITEKKLVKDAIREAEKKNREQYQSIIDTAMDAIISIDEEQIIQQFNSSAEHIFLYDKKDVIGKPVDILIPDRFKNIHRTHVRDFDSTNSTKRSMGELGSLFGVRSDGEEFPIEASISQVSVGGKKLFTVILRDITKRIKAEKELKEIHERFIRTINNMSDQFLVLDKDFRFEFVNDSLLNRIHMNRDELIGKVIWEAIPPVKGSELEKNLKKAMDEQELVSFIDYGPVTGEPIEVHLYPSEEGILGFSKDISERKKAEEQIRQSKQKLENILETIGDIFVAFDRNLNITYLNSKALKSFKGLSPDEIINRNIFEIFPEMKGTFVEKSYRKALDENVPVKVDFEGVYSDGVFELNVFPSPDGLAVYVKDITDRKNTEEKLKEANKQIKNILETVSDNFFALDKEFRFKYVNQSVLDRMKLNPEDIIGRSIWEIYPGLKNTIFEENYLKAFNEQKRINFIGKSIISNTWFDVIIYPSENGITIYSKDITEKLEAENKLKEANEQIENMLKAVSDTFFAFDNDFKFKFINNRTLELTNLSEEEIKDKSIWEVFPTLIGTEFEEHYKKAVAEKKPVNFVAFGPITGRWLDASLYPSKDGVTAYMRDITVKKQSEEKLIEAYNYRKAIEDSIPAGLSAVGTDGTQTYVNAAMCKLLGYEEHELTGAKAPFVYWPEEELPKINEAFEKTISGNAPADGFELVFKKKTGERIDVQVIPTALKNIKGEIDGWLASVTDISKRKKAERELIESEERFRTIAETANEGIWMIDKNAETVFANGVMTEMLGFVDKEFEGKVTDFVFDEDKEAILERINANLNGFNEEFDFQFRKLDGSGLHVLAGTSPFYDSSGKIAGALGMFSDITDRKNSEIALRESEERFRTLADNISQFAWMADDKGSLFWYNKRWFDYTGTTFEEMEGSGWKKVHHPDYADKVEEKFRRFIESGEPWEDIFPLRSKQGEYRWFLSRALPIRNSEGKIVEWFGTNTDITSQRKLEEDLLSALDSIKESEEKYKTKSQELETLLDAIPSVVWIAHDPECKVMTGNKASYDFLELAQGVNVSASTSAVLNARIVEQRINGVTVKAEDLPMQKSVRLKKPVPEVEIEMIFNNGYSRILYGNAVPVFDDKGNVTGSISAFIDVTERKKIETELKISQEMYKEKSRELETILETIPTPVWIAKDPEANIIEGNKAANMIMGLPEGENASLSTNASVLTELVTQHINGVEVQPSELPIQRCLATGELIKSAEIEFRYPSGKSVFLLGNAAPVFGSNNRIKGCISAFTDITELKKYQTALIENEDRLRFSLKSAYAGSWEWNVKTGDEKWSDEFYELFGLDPDEVQPSFENWVSTIHPDDRDRVLQDVKTAVENIDTDLDTEFRSYHSKKGMRWINAIGKAVYSENGEPVKMAGISLDITERKIAESHLKIQYSISNALTEAKTLKDATYSVLQSICNELGWELGIWWVVDKEKNLLKIESIWKIDGIKDSPKGITDPNAVFKPGEGLPGDVWIKANPMWVQDIMSDSNFPRKKLAVKLGLHAALAFPTRSGEEVTGIIECFSREILNPKKDLLELFDAAGRQIGNFVERKKAEAKYQDLYENAPDMYVSFDSSTGEITQCNKTLAASTGYSTNEIVGQTIFNIFHKDCRKQLSIVRKEFAEKGEVKNAELQLRRKDDSKIDVILNASAIRDEDGNIIYSRSSLRDITERKKFELAIKQRDVELTDFIEKAPVGLSRISEEGIILWSNKMDMQSFGYSKKQFINHNIREFLLDESLWDEILHKLNNDEVIKNMDIQVKGKNGSIKNLLFSANVYKEDGKLVYIKTFTRDITARKIAETHLNIQYSISTTLAEARTLKSAAEKAIETICEGLGLQTGLWWMADEEAGNLKHLAEWHSKSLKTVNYDFIKPGYTIDKGEGLPGKVWQQEKTIWISSISRDNKFQRKELSESMGLYSAFAFPIRIGEKVIAVVECFGNRVILANQELIEMLNSTGRQMGNFIERIKAEDALKEANETLEDKVKERTAQLKNVIDKLEHEIKERQKAEEEIEILAQAMKSTNDSVCITDLRNRILFVNGAFEKTYGYSEDEVLGKSVNIIKPKQLSAELSRKIFDSTIRGGWQGEIVHLKKNGTEFPVWLSTSVIKDNQGSPRALINVSLDITESKKTQMLLQQQADLVKLLQEITVAANQTFNLDEALKFTVDKICAFTKWEIGHVHEIDKNKIIKSTKIWHIENARKFNTFRNITERTVMKPGRGIPGMVFKLKKPLWLTDVTKSKYFVRRHPTLDVKVRSAFAFPVVVENEVVCVLEFFTTKIIKPKEQILEVMYSIGTQLGRVAERQRAIETIRDSETKFKAVAETANDAIISIDSGNNIIYFNNSAETIFGYKEEELIGNSFLKLFTNQNRKILKDAYDDITNTGTSTISGKTIEMTGLKKNRDEFPLELSISNWQTSDGLYFTATIRDITERKDAELKLLKNEKLLSEAQHIANIGSFEWDIAKNKLYWSDELYRIYGLKRNEFDGTFEGFLKNIDPQDRETIQQAIIEAYQNAAPFSLEGKVIRPNGEVRILLTRGEFIKDETGKTVRLVGACQDITARKEAEEQLRRSEKGLKDSQRIAHLGSWEWNVSTNEVSYSDEFLRIYGVEPKNFDPAKFDPNKFIHPDDKEWAARLAKTLIANQKPFSVHYRIILQDGTTKVLKAEGQVEKEADGKAARMFGSVLDVTEQKLAEEELREANEKLKQAQNELIHSEKLAALGRFSSGIAHEIRNPLANISALAQILMSKYKVDPKMKKHLRYILINTDIANRIIKDLLNFASPDEAPFKYGSIEKIINNLYNIVKSRCVRNKVHLIKQITTKLPDVLLNEKKLQAAFLNFISNAIDAMPKGGKLRIETVYNKKTNEVIVIFEDTGVGISQEYMDKIFEPFFTTKDDGTGLGLSLAYQVIKSHEGKLEIQSRVGHGTKIEVIIPAKKEIKLS